MEDHTTVYVLDDDWRILNSLKALLSSAGFRVQCFLDPPSFFKGADLNAPSCLILDINLGTATGFDVMQKINASRSAISVVVLSGTGDIRSAVKTMKYGAFEFLPKPIETQELLLAVNTALIRAAKRCERLDALRRVNERYGKLTPRERDVLPYVVRGYLNKQTAYELGRSEITIRIHRGNIMRKMQSASLPDLVRQAFHLGIG